MIGPSQGPVSDNTQNSQEKDIHDSGGIRTHNPGKRAAADPHIRPRGHWIIITSYKFIIIDLMLIKSLNNIRSGIYTRGFYQTRLRKVDYVAS